MISTDRLTRELSQVFGENAVLTNQTYVQTLQVLHAMALSASAQNATQAVRGSPALASVYADEAAVFSAVAQELRRTTARIQDILDGVTAPPSTQEGASLCNC